MQRVAVADALALEVGERAYVPSAPDSCLLRGLNQQKLIDGIEAGGNEEVSFCCAQIVLCPLEWQQAPPGVLLLLAPGFDSQGSWRHPKQATCKGQRTEGVTIKRLL